MVKDVDLIPWVVDLITDGLQEFLEELVLPTPYDGLDSLIKCYGLF